VGRLTEIKNHEMFLRVAARYKEKHQSARRIRFVVIGDGHLRDALEDQSRALGLTADIAFVGTRKDPEFFYPALDVVALTSRNEGTPLTLIEAMLNQRPVIATAVGGVGDLLGQTWSAPASAGYKICERGVCVAANDDAGFAAGLAHLIDDEELRRKTGERAYRFVERHYAVERLLQDITELYRQIMRTRPAAVSAPVRQTPVCR
jgi:glycosyltransferase involved in cell wall biosynthesis